MNMIRCTLWVVDAVLFAAIARTLDSLDRQIMRLDRACSRTADRADRRAGRKVAQVEAILRKHGA